jgi:hypothetical protein
MCPDRKWGEEERADGQASYGAHLEQTAAEHEEEEESSRMKREEQAAVEAAAALLGVKDLEPEPEPEPARTFKRGRRRFSLSGAS